MRWSVKIVRVAGTEIRLHITFLLFLAWIGFAYYHAGGAEAALRGVVFIALLFSSVVLHEFGHVVAARRFGIQTPDITLLPIGGVARLRRMPTEPLQDSPALPVIDSRRRLVGILTVENVGELMMIRTVARGSRNLGWRVPEALRPHSFPQA